MEPRCEIRQQVMAASFSVHYYGALGYSDKAGMIIDIVFAIADIVTGDTFGTQLLVTDLLGALRCDVILYRPCGAVSAEVPNVAGNRFSIGFRHRSSLSSYCLKLYLVIFPIQGTFNDEF